MPSTTPLTTENHYLIGDSLKLCHPYQADEFRAYRHLGVCENAEMWSPEELELLSRCYGGKQVSDYPMKIGLYTQGFWLRLQKGASGPVVGGEFARQEEDLATYLVTYLTQHHDVQLFVFPHPIERRHYQQTGEYQFKTLAEHPQVTFDVSDTSSMTSFDQIGLGITISSTVGFDRLYNGFSHALLCTSQPFYQPEN